MAFDLFQEGVLQGVLLAISLFVLGKFGQAQPSRRTLFLAFLPTILLIPAFWLPWLADGLRLYLPTLTLILLIDCFGLSLRPQQLTFGRTMNVKWAIGQRNSITLFINNQSQKPLIGFVQDGIPEGLQADDKASAPLPLRIEGGGQQAITYFLRAHQRGPYRFELPQIRYASPLGLLWRIAERPQKTDNVDIEEFIRVLPDWRRERRLRLLAARAGRTGETDKRGCGTEGDRFSNLRPYSAGDALRKMAWQATARLDAPVVRVFEPAVEQPLLLLLDAGQRMAGIAHGLQKYDWVLGTALALAGVALDRRNKVGVGIFSSKILAETALRSGRGQRQHILDTLSITQVQTTEADYESVLPHFARPLKQSTLVILFTDLADPIAAAGLSQSLRCFSTRHPVLIVTVFDSQLTQAATQWPESSHEAYRRGAAQDLLNLRRHTLKVLTQGIRGRRVTIVDSPPEKLDEALLRHYFRMQQA